MKITLPENYPLPENARPGEPFEAVATLKPNEDGSFELTAIDGVELGGDPEMEAMSPAAEFAKKIPLPWGGGTA